MATAAKPSFLVCQRLGLGVSPRARPGRLRGRLECGSSRVSQTPSPLPLKSPCCRGGLGAWWMREFFLLGHVAGRWDLASLCALECLSLLLTHAGCTPTLRASTAAIPLLAMLFPTIVAFLQLTCPPSLVPQHLVPGSHVAPAFVATGGVLTCVRSGFCTRY